MVVDVGGETGQLGERVEAHDASIAGVGVYPME